MRGECVAGVGGSRRPDSGRVTVQTIGDDSSCMRDVWLRIRRLLCGMLRCQELTNQVPPVGDEVDFNPESKLSEADLTKLLESSRSEIRSYQALYISLLAFSVASITVLTKLPGWDPSPAPFKLAILLIWIVGIVTLVVGVYSIVPRFTPRSKRLTDLQVLIHLDRALTEKDQNSAKASLGKAVRVTFRIQRQVADAKSHFKRGVALVLIALIAMAIWSAFVRERSVSRETQQPGPNGSSGRTTNK